MNVPLQDNPLEYLKFYTSLPAEYKYSPSDPNFKVLT